MRISVTHSTVYRYDYPVYLEPHTFRLRVRQDSYIHAWAEVYLPGAGWRGYDPSRGLAASRVHVLVSAGFDHDLARPMAGLYRSGSRSQMEASLRMHVDPDRSTS